MPLPEAVDSQELLRFYKTLYTSARDEVRKFYPELERQAEDRLHSQDQSKQATISYNLAMTTGRMMLCPRRSETAMVSDSTVLLENSSDPVDSQPPRLTAGRCPLAQIVLPRTPARELIVRQWQARNDQLH